VPKLSAFGEPIKTLPFVVVVVSAMAFGPDQCGTTHAN
jgi:hypothetical protein